VSISQIHVKSHRVLAVIQHFATQGFDPFINRNNDSIFNKNAARQDLLVLLVHEFHQLHDRIQVCIFQVRWAQSVEQHLTGRAVVIDENLKLLRVKVRVLGWGVLAVLLNEVEDRVESIPQHTGLFDAVAVLNKFVNVVDYWADLVILNAHRGLQVLEQNVKALLEIDVEHLLAVVGLSSGENLGPGTSKGLLYQVVGVDDLLVTVFENQLSVLLTL
jgi:hypothetical protein